MDIKSWLEQTREPVAKTAFTKQMQAPFIVYLDDVRRRGHDFGNTLTAHSVTIEHYTEDGNDASLIKLFEEAGIHYEHEQQWMNKEECFLTIFYLEELFEKEIIT